MSRVEEARRGGRVGFSPRSQARVLLWLATDPRTPLETAEGCEVQIRRIVKAEKAKQS